MICEHNSNVADDDCQNMSDDYALLDNYTSSNGLEMECDEDGNHESGT